jgi:hypothetical protein
MFVNSFSKLLVSAGPLVLRVGLKGGVMLRLYRSSQLIVAKNGCARTSAPPLAPSRWSGFRFSSAYKKQKRIGHKVSHRKRKKKAQNRVRAHLDK